MSSRQLHSQWRFFGAADASSQRASSRRRAVRLRRRPRTHRQPRIPRSNKSRATFKRLCLSAPAEASRSKINSAKCAFTASRAAM